MPIILASASGFWDASQKLDNMCRERDVLVQHAEEEAAKILILMDMVRCPEKMRSSKTGNIIAGFYAHLARLIYARATSWRPTDINELREYVDDTRCSHYREGYLGEYILPNQEITNRECKLYADIEANEDGYLVWNTPQGNKHSFSTYKPNALQVTEAMSALGMLKFEGLHTIAEVWNELEFKDIQGPSDNRQLTRRLLGKIMEKNLHESHAEQEHVEIIYNFWQMPMYNLDFGLINVPLEKLQEEREVQFWAETV
ncbi:MAG: hypothetical protein JO126_00980 [Alphaproteobacteria bacterium]|nr:hypothetical protein [Alphaproteobacteria bacterium]